MYHGNWQRITDSNNGMALNLATRQHGDERVRTLDLDMFSYCQKCLAPTLIAEATSATSDKSTLMVREMAKNLGAVAIFVRHEYNDLKNEHPIYFAMWGVDGRCIIPLRKTTWEDTRKAIRYAQDLHEERTGCARKKARYLKAEYEKLWFNQEDYAAADEEWEKKQD